MQPDDFQRALVEIHGRFATQLDHVVSIHLPEAVDERFRGFFDALSLEAQPIPQWVMSFHHVQEAVMTAYYHRRNVERIETTAIEIVREALGKETRPLPPTNMSIGARTLTAEYQAYLLAIRRAFEYLARGIARYFGVRSTHFPGLPVALENAQPAELARRLTQVVQRTLDDLRDPFHRRNLLSHEEPVVAGQLEIAFEPGSRPEVALIERVASGSEARLFSANEPRLGSALGHQLGLVEERIFDFIGRLPEARGAQH